MNMDTYVNHMNALRDAAQVFFELDISIIARDRDIRTEIMSEAEPESYLIGMAHAFGLQRQHAISAFHKSGYRKCQELRSASIEYRKELEGMWPDEWHS